MLAPRNSRKCFSQQDVPRNLGIWDEARDPSGSAPPRPRAAPGFSRDPKTLPKDLLPTPGIFQRCQDPLGASGILGPMGTLAISDLPATGAGKFHHIPEGKFLFIPFQTEISSHSKGEFSSSSHPIPEWNFIFIPFQREIPEGIFLFFIPFQRGILLFFPFQREIPEGNFLFIPFLIPAFPRILPTPRFPTPTEHSIGKEELSLFSADSQKNPGGLAGLGGAGMGGNQGIPGILGVNLGFGAHPKHPAIPKNNGI